MSDYQENLYRLICGICGVLGLCLAAVMALGSLTGDFSSRVFAAVMLLAFFILCCLALLKWPLFPRPAYTMAAMGLIFLSLCLRLSLFDHQSGDYVSFLSVWTETMRNMTLRQALSTPIGDYNMPYLYLILLISRLPFSDLYCIKLFSVLADLAAALALGHLARLVTKKQSTILLALAAALLVPTTWLGSSYWGQCDSVYGALALWGLYCGLTGRSSASMALFSLSLAFKLQAIFLLPIILFLLMTEKVELKSVWVFPAVFLAAMVPALLGGRSFSDTFSIYWSQTQSYPYLSLNAPSFWCLIDNSYYYELEPAPVLLAMILVLLLVFVFLRKYRNFDTKALMELSLIFSLAIPWLLPKMHERYFYLAEMLSILYAVCYPKRTPAAVILTFGGFLIYCAYLFGEVPVLSLRLIAAIYGILLLYLLSRLWRRVSAPRIAPQKSPEETVDKPDGTW